MSSFTDKESRATTTIGNSNSCSNNRSASSSCATSCASSSSSESLPSKKETDPLQEQRQQLLHSIYNEDKETFLSLLQTNPIFLTEYFGGYALIHYLIEYYWEEGLSLYETVLHGDITLITQDKLLSLEKSIPLYITGGRNILHLLALKIPTVSSSIEETQRFESYCGKFPHLVERKDFNGHLPIDLAQRSSSSDGSISTIGTAAWHRLQYQQVKSRCYLDITSYGSYNSTNAPTTTTVVYDIQPVLQDSTWGPSKNVMHSFQVDFNLIDSFSQEIINLEESIPNSMHRYGKLLLPQMQTSIYRLVYTLLQESQEKEYREHIDKITSIYAFYIKYSATTGPAVPSEKETATAVKATNRSLGKHKDDSSITINLCLRNSSTTGALVIDDLDGYVYKHTAGKGIFHHGSLLHHVEEIQDGERENIIIWVRY